MQATDRATNRATSREEWTELWFEAGVVSLSPRSFVIREAISQLFEVSVMARSLDPSIDLEALVGRPAALNIYALGIKRCFRGVLVSAEQTRVEASMIGESTYSLSIAPMLWLLGQRRNYRTFQHTSVPEIVERILREWSIECAFSMDRGAYPKLEYRVQYGETDLAFLSRLLQEAGIAYTFDTDDTPSRLTFSDKLGAGKPHPRSPLPFVDTPTGVLPHEFVTKVHLRHAVRPGAYTIRDYDLRNPNFTMQVEAPKAKAPEDRLEQYAFHDGAMLVEGARGGGTPVADDKSVARLDERFGHDLAARRLGASRHEKRVISYETNTMILAPGVIFSIESHPHAELSGPRLLATEARMTATLGDEWEVEGRAIFAADEYYPPFATPKPEARGVETAVVVGPPGEEIYTDEFGRVRVQFPWDREGKNDDNSSCWMRVSQGWAGTGFGSIMIPRVGQEVLVGFIGADPDRPLVVGRVFNIKQPVPYRLPEHKSRSTWKSDSYPGGGGFNEITFEDAKYRELVYMQAQKDLRALVKNDQTETVGHDLSKLVKHDELEETGGRRFETTRGDRIERTVGARMVIVDGSRGERVFGEQVEVTDGNHRVRVDGTQDIVVRAVKKEHLHSDSHRHVDGDDLARVEGSASLSVGGSRDEKVGDKHALSAGREIHLHAGEDLVIESGVDLTLKGPGGFIRIDASGVTIVGDFVRINSGGTPGSGSGASPKAPEDAFKAEIEPPDPPELEDVGKTGIGQRASTSTSTPSS